MSFIINKITLETSELKTNALAFIPSEPKNNYCGVFTHGYTSHKGSILPWAQKMMELSIPTILFDLPGHFLGSFNDVSTFEVFSNQTHELFNKAHEILGRDKKLISGGHSLGGLFSLIHAKDYQPELIFCAGLGLSDPKKTHLFQTPFFKETMNLRSELVSKTISPEITFPWISKTKQNLSCKEKKIVLVAGKDDIIIDKEVGLNRLGNILKKNNQVEIIAPPSLPHNQPERAGVYLKQVAKKILNLP
mgnify:CR=1 FL=1|jgi:hypothetical protein